MNTGPIVATCYLCRGHTHFEKLEDVPKPFVCICLEKPADKTDYKVCGTCFRGSYWNRSTIFKKFECPFCKESKSNSGKFQIKIMPTPQNPTVHRSKVSINLHDIYKRKKEREESKRRAERVEMAELIADRLNQKTAPEIEVHELEEK